jgi:hypothetical protein
MARKPAAAAPTVADVEMDTDALGQAGHAMTVMAQRSLEVAERYGDGTPYERHRVVSEARFFMSQSAEAMLEAGKRLIQIKENEPHGDFIEIVEGQLGIGERSARLMMQAAVKYLSPKLAAKRQTFAVLGKSKLFDLMGESNDDLADLADGGTLAGVTLDEIECMSARELKAALRERDQQLEAKDKVIAAKDQKLNKLDEQLHRPWLPPEDSVARTAEQQAILDAMRTYVIAAETALLQLATVCSGIFDSNAPEAVHDLARNNLEYLAQCVADLSVSHGIELDMSKRIVPEWVRQVRETAAKKQPKA